MNFKNVQVSGYPFGLAFGYSGYMAQKIVPKATWNQIKKEYVTGQKGIRELAREYGLSSSTICEKAKREGWKEKAEQLERKAERIMEEKALNQAATNADLAAKTLHALLVKVAEAVEVIDAQDTNATKQLTQCMKDLKDMGVFAVVTEDSGASISLGEELSDYGG